jgi:hypothetical protein
MADKRELRINTLDRYLKTSDRLLLQTYTSCEVPLGCGGAIHRWIDPAQSLPMVLFRDFGDRKATVFLDGVECSNPRVDVTPGKHVLSIEFESSPLSLSLRLLLAYENKSNAAEKPDPKRSPVLASKDDGRWYGTTTPPRGAWQTAAEPVEGWVALRAFAKPTRAKQAYLDRRIDSAASIGLSTNPGMAWVRRVFSLDTSDEWILS